MSALGPAFLPWGPLALDGAQPADVDALLRAGCVGVSLPAATGAAATSTLLSSAPITLTWSWLMNVLTFATPWVGVDLSSSTFR